MRMPPCSSWPCRWWCGCKREPSGGMWAGVWRARRQARESSGSVVTSRTRRDSTRKERRSLTPQRHLAATAGNHTHLGWGPCGPVCCRHGCCCCCRTPARAACMPSPAAAAEMGGSDRLRIKSVDREAAAGGGGGRGGRGRPTALATARGPPLRRQCTMHVHLATWTPPAAR